MRRTLKHLIYFFLAHLEGNERGASMFEYAILVAILSIAAIALVFILGGQVMTPFQTAVDAFSAGDQE
jgi:pilus assembly protein Flp/PilA